MKRQDQSRLEFYQKLQVNFTPAKHIDLPSFKIRKTIAKLRCSNHCLEIEKGRHRNIPREDRICNMCTDKVVEDEEHFLTKCTSYGHMKMKYEVSVDSAVDFMIYTNQKNLAQYLISAFNFRKERLEENKEQ